MALTKKEAAELLRLATKATQPAPKKAKTASKPKATAAKAPTAAKKNAVEKPAKK